MTINRVDNESRITFLTNVKTAGKEIVLKIGPSHESDDYHGTTVNKAIAIHQSNSQESLRTGFLAIELMEYDPEQETLETIAPLLFLPTISEREPHIMELLQTIERSQSILPKQAAEQQEIIRNLFHEVLEIIAPAKLIPYPDY